MRVLENLQPKEVFYYFEEISKIPHGSYNIGAISDYLKNFALERNLFCIQDEWKNIIIVKEATPGYEQEEPVILQGHMDMVAVKKPELDKDMKTEGLELGVKDDLIYAEGTSLGGDDGIAVAYALALLDSKEIAHPRLEIVITVDEEVGLDGARVIDLSMLKGKRMLNVDSEDEGIFLSSCAGGARVQCVLPLQKENVSGIAYRVKIKGLLGGHSGESIIKERGNSNCLMGRLIYELSKIDGVALVSAQGGLADNAIPRETEAVLLVSPEQKEQFEEIVKTVEGQIQRELAVKDPGACIEMALDKEVNEQSAVCGEMLKKAASLMIALPNGIQAMSADVKGLVETSLNMGMLKLGDELNMVFSVRSSLESAKHCLIEKIAAIMNLAQGEIEVSGDYPGWAYRQDSPLRDKMTRVYERMYGKAPEIKAIHAGLECGLISSKIDNLDCVSIGPDMNNIHTTEETLSISSTKRVWEFIVELLKEKDV